MYTYDSAYRQLLTNLQPLYDAREASAMAHELLTFITGADKLQRVTERDTTLTDEETALYEAAKSRLVKGEPLQYVMGKAWFMGFEFEVNEHVLIPRPETEELVLWIVDENKGKDISILDIGTGSGCIPISLHKGLRTAQITSIDISQGAIETAKLNAEHIAASVRFMQLDFLQKENWPELSMYDLIVSNPPYIPETERETLHANVKEHEPALALFVPGDDALLFYRNIAAFGKEHLNKGGTIYCELHVDYAAATGKLFEDMGYMQVELRKDMNGNMRMLKATQ